MRVVIVISVSRVEGIILLLFGVVGLLAFVVMAMKVNNFIRVIQFVRVIAVFFF